MFIVNTHNNRLIAKRELSKEDFDLIAKQISQNPQPLSLKKIYRPSVAIRFAQAYQDWVTYNNTGVENTLLAKPGDAFITRLDSNGKIARGFASHPNTYVIDGADVPLLFDPLPEYGNITEQGEDFGAVYSGKNIVLSLCFEGGLSIVCSWGPQQIENQKAYLFYSLITHTVYGCDEGGFEAYEPCALQAVHL